MSGPARILVFNYDSESSDSLPHGLSDQYQIVQPKTLEDGLLALQNEEFAGLFFVGP